MLLEGKQRKKNNCIKEYGELLPGGKFTGILYVWDVDRNGSETDRLKTKAGHLVREGCGSKSR